MKPTVYRHPINYDDENYLNEDAINNELERVFDICHGCRRCFNLCDSFPTLFDLIDETPGGEVVDIAKKDYQKVADSCTLCDICYSIKCPYVPPHDFDVDFPKLMLRHKALLNKKNGQNLSQKVLSQPDYVFPIASKFSTITNKINAADNKIGRKILSAVADIHPKAYLPKFQSETLVTYGKKNGFDKKSLQKVVLFATCLGNYSEIDIGKSALNIFKKIGIHPEIVYPGCCGMPLFEQGKVEDVAGKALKISAFFKPYLEDGYTIISLVPSCSFMIKKEWPLLHPNNEDIQKLSRHTMDLCEAFVFYGKEKDIFKSVENESVLLHLACHARAQNQGPKAAEMLRLVKGLNVKIIERCSGHGGNFGVKNDTFDIAVKVGRPVVRQYEKEGENIHSLVISECPLAGHHIHQGLDNPDFIYKHPVQILENFLK